MDFTAAAVIFVFMLPLAVVWGILILVRRGRTRPCPRCGHRVRRGEMDCNYCEFDFRTVGS